MPVGNSGLVQVQRQVNKNGKTFTQHFWVKPNEVKSTDVVLQQPTGSPDTSAKVTQNSDPKKTMIGLLSSHSRGDMITYAKKVGVTWSENQNEGINWMRASMAIQKHISANPDTWSNDKMSGKDNQQSQTTTQPAPATETKPEPKTPVKSNDDSKQKVKELAQTMGKSELMEAAKAAGVTWAEHDHQGVNWMRASMAISSALTENPDLLSKDTQQAELKITQEKVKKLENLVAQIAKPTAQQVAQQQAKVDVLKGITTDFKSSREQKVFGDAMSKATPEQFMRARTLGMCADDGESAEYLARLYEQYVATMKGVSPATKKYDPMIDSDPLRNKLQGVVNKQVVGVVKSSLSNVRKRSTQFTMQMKLLEPWVDPNTPLDDEAMAAIKAAKGGTAAGSARVSNMTETDGSHGLMKRVLDKMATSTEYGDLAKEYKTILEEYDKLTECDPFLQTITYGEKTLPTSQGILSSLENKYESIKNQLSKQRQYEMDSARRVKEITEEIKTGETDPNSKYYINPNMNSWSQDEQRKKNAGIITAYEKSHEGYQKSVSEWEDRRDHYEDLFDRYEANTAPLIKAGELRRKLYDPKFTDLNANLWHMKAMGAQLAVQYQIKKDFVSDYPILSKENLDKLENGDQEALTNLSLYAGMFKPSLSKQGDSKDIIMEKYRERQELLATYGGVTSSQNTLGNYTEDNEVKCKVSRASAQKTKEITDNIQRDWDRNNHGNMKYRIKGVYEVSGLAVEKEFESIKKQHTGRSGTYATQTARGQGKNATSDMFYHGTGAMATSLILGHSGEFKVGKAKVGRMLGDGIYLADKASKSAQYISDSGYSRHGIKGSLMVVEASLGTTTGRPDMRNWDSYDTVFGGKSHQLLNNEWCVHNPKAVIPRYLVEMEII